ncbi:MAG: hypothetical protein QOJ11_40 [Frankiales bacterium]|nr:hypothetical protein [Frankiales bacterium]
MLRSMFALCAIAAMVPAGMWCTLRAAAAADLTVMPLRARRRLNSWQKHARQVYVGSGSLAVVVGLIQFLRFAL